MAYKKCYGCGIEMGLDIAEYHVEFNDGEEVDVCLSCVKGYFDEIPEQIIKVEAI